MKIAFTGLPSTGKSTLIQKIREVPEFADYIVPPSVGRSLKAMGIPINEDGTVETQVGAFSLHFRYADVSPRVLHERSIIDVLAFSLASGNFPDSQNTVFYELVKFNVKTKPMYDKIIYLPPVIPFVEDGVRTTNEQFLVDLERCFLDIFDNLELDEKLFHKVESYGIEERFEEVLNFINDK